MYTLDQVELVKSVLESLCFFSPCLFMWRSCHFMNSRYSGAKFLDVKVGFSSLAIDSCKLQNHSNPTVLKQIYFCKYLAPDKP